MPIGVVTTIQFDFDNTVSGIQSVSGFFTFQAAPSFTIVNVPAGQTAVFTAAGGITFTYSQSTGATGFDSTNDNRLSPGLGGTGTLDVGSGLNFTNAQFNVVGVAPGDTNLIEFLNSTGAVVGSLTDNQIAAGPINFNGVFDSIRFSTSNGFQISSLTTTLNCFCAGTRIATPDGPVAVEDLKAGDRILKADGGSTEVAWLGRQAVDVSLSHPEAVNPICISAGTLGNAQDLFVSPDHGIALDGHLINASALVNGDTIYQVARMPVEGFTYYHVDTGRHEVILAEGVAVESYVDMPSRESFDNGFERAGAAPIPVMALPRISSARLVPEDVRARLAQAPAHPLALAG